MRLRSSDIIGVQVDSKKVSFVVVDGEPDQNNCIEAINSETKQLMSVDRDDILTVDFTGE